MKRPVNPQVADSRTKKNNKRSVDPYPKDAYTHATSVNGNRDTTRRPVKAKRAKIKAKRAKKV
jgi:hypothetical protein